MYVPVGCIVGAIHMQNTIARERRKEAEEQHKEGPTVMKFRKKPIVIEAYQTRVPKCVYTHGGVLLADKGDWIITEVNGEQYPCKPDIFEKLYERVE